jgi:WS/DGAT/MGAT family acyltransferase
MARVGLADRLFLAAESTQTPQHVAALGVFWAPDDAGDAFVAALARGFRAAREFAPPFNYRLAHPRLKTVAPSWTELADDEIDLDYHFRHNALPRPGGQLELGQLISRLHSRALDPTKPLWELHLIEGLEDGRFAFYFKVHHALMDGIGGAQRFAGMVTPDPDDDELRPIWTIAPRGDGTRAPVSVDSPELSRLDHGHHAIRTAVRGAADAVGLATGLAGVAVRMGREVVKPTDAARATPFATPRTILNGRIGQQRRVATQTFAFSRLRDLADAAGVTINDVFLAICAGGLRSYLGELGALPDAGLTAGTPVSVRARGDEQSTNAFTMTVMQLATDIADPVKRLAAIHRSSSLAKADLAGLARNVVENQAALFMGPFIAQQLTPLAGQLPPPYNVSVSNVPGPLEPQYLVGARLESLAPLALVYHGVGLFIAAFTISESFTIGFVGDRDSLPHVQRLAIASRNALAELEAAHGKVASRSRQPVAK